eukprot:4982195-Amphidinium_carterae.1
MFEVEDGKFERGILRQTGKEGHYKVEEHFGKKVTLEHTHTTGEGPFAQEAVRNASEALVEQVQHQSKGMQQSTVLAPVQAFDLETLLQHVKGAGLGPGSSNAKDGPATAGNTDGAASTSSSSNSQDSDDDADSDADDTHMLFGVRPKGKAKAAAKLPKPVTKGKAMAASPSRPAPSVKNSSVKSGSQTGSPPKLGAFGRSMLQKTRSQRSLGQDPREGWASLPSQGEPSQPQEVAVAAMDGRTNRLRETMTMFKTTEFPALMENIKFTEQPTGKGANAAEEYSLYCKERKKLLTNAHNALKEKVRRVDSSKQKEIFHNDLEWLRSREKLVDALVQLNNLLPTNNTTAKSTEFLAAVDQVLEKNIIKAEGLGPGIWLKVLGCHSAQAMVFQDYQRFA